MSFFDIDEEVELKPMPFVPPKGDSSPLTDENKELHCSFCGSSTREVLYMIKGNGEGACICGKCTELCVAQIREHAPDFCKKDYLT
jgi:hypothetical protein